MTTMANTTGEDAFSEAFTREGGALRLRRLSKNFGEGSGEVVRAVDSIDLTINTGEFITLLGPSGCGKTTTLRMIAGFEDPSGGEITLDGESIVRIPPNERPMSMVFQSYALFPHMTVYENVAYGLRLQKLSKERIQQDVDFVLTSMNLRNLHNRAPNELSGGQQQRVALARALVMKPKVLLFDEPLSNLDAKLRVMMRTEIRRLQESMGITSVYVTHDQEEAMAMSDRIVVMNAGRIAQVGTPAEIYRRPKSLFVADFLGRANFIEVANIRVATDTHANVDLIGKDIYVPKDENIVDAERATLMVRPESVSVFAMDSGLQERAYSGRIISTVFYGQVVEYEIETAKGNLVAHISDPAPEAIFETGTNVAWSVEFERTWLIPSEGDT